MEQIRPFPPTDFIDQAEEEEAIRIGVRFLYGATSILCEGC